jgi:hypothetical protein
MAQEYNTFHIYDRSAPTMPVELGHCTMGPYTDPWIRDMAVLGDAVYLASYWAGVGVINIANPTTPFQEATLEPEDARSVDLSGDLLLAVFQDGLRVFSVGDPHHPQWLGTDAFYGNDPGDVVSAGSYACIPQGSSGVRVITVGEPAAPTTVARFDSGGTSHRNAVVGNLLYVAALSSGLNIFDVSNPVTPALVGNVTTGDDVANVTVSGNYAYLGNGGQGLQMVDVSDPSQPRLAGRYFQSDGPCTDVALQGSYAYVAQNGLKVVSLENPALPLHLGWWQHTGWPSWQAVAVQGDYAYMPDVEQSGGIRAISVEDPTAPTPVGFVQTYADALSLSCSGHLLYVADGNLRIIDITDHQSMWLVSGLATPGDATDLFVADTLIYVADGEAGLQIVVASDPAHPRTVGNFVPPGKAQGVCVSASRAYVAAGPAGLVIVDVSDPASPVFLGQHDTPGNAWRVAVSGDYALVTDRHGGLQVVNVSVPSTPYLYTAASYGTGSFFYDLAVSGNQLVVATADELLVLQMEVYTGAYLVGDVNADSTITSSDVVYLVNFVFKGGPQPLANYRSGDVDCNGQINSSDVIRLVNYVFKSGEVPECGP